MKYEEYEAALVKECQKGIVNVLLIISFILLLLLVTSPLLLIWSTFILFIKVSTSLAFLFVLLASCYRWLKKISIETAKRIAKETYKPETAVKSRFMQKLENAIKEAQRKQNERKN